MLKIRLFFLSFFSFWCLDNTLASDVVCWWGWRNLDFFWVKKPASPRIWEGEDVERSLDFVRADIGEFSKNLYLLPEHMDMDRISSLEQKIGSFKDTIGPNISYLCKERNIEKDRATKLALIVLFKPSWNASIKLLEKICGNGGLTHKYTLEEALFVLYMLPQKPNFLRRMWSSESYKNERIFYLSCLAGAIAYILEFYKKIELNLFSSVEVSSDREQMLIDNVIRLKNAAQSVFEDGMFGKFKLK